MDEFGSQRKDEEQLPKRIHHDLCHSGCRTDLGIDAKVLQEGLNRLEQVNKSIMYTNVLDSLKHLCSTDTHVGTKEGDIRQLG